MDEIKNFVQIEKVIKIETWTTLKLKDKEEGM